MDDIDFIKEALKEAKKAYKKNEVPIGAVVVKNGKIIAKAHNLIEYLIDPSAHAEVIAIRRAAKKLKNWRLNNCIVYSTCEPCPICEAVLLQARINKVVFGCNTLKNVVKAKFKKSKFIRKGPILENECKTILKKFFAKYR
ncbi:MAG: nucleoside deaminase [Elusimicrobiota bacterium]